LLRRELMALPPELIEEPADTAVVGDIDAFITYIESGRAQKDWQERLDLRLREFDELFRNPTMAAA
jgi:hypothetical protein